MAAESTAKRRWFGRNLAPSRLTFDRGIPPSELSDLANSLGFNISFVGGEPVAVPRELGDVDVQTFSQLWRHNQAQDAPTVQNRLSRFRAYERMDSNGGVASIALDTYADEIIYSGVDIEDTIQIEISDKKLEEQIKETLAINKIIDHTRADLRAMVKYGDLSYVISGRPGVDLVSDEELIQNPDQLKKTKVPILPKDIVLSPIHPRDYELDGIGNNVYRLRLMDTFIGPIDYTKKEFMPWEFVTFSIEDRDTFPYGKPLSEAIRGPWNELDMVEQLLAITRANRVDKLAFELPQLGPNADPSSQLNRLSQFKNSLKTIIFGAGSFNASTGRMTRNQDQPLTEYLFIPSGVKANRLSTSLEVGGIEDVEYFKDNFIDSSRIPQSYFTTDESDNRPGNLINQDLRFSRFVKPVGKSYCRSLERLITLIAFYLGADISEFRCKVSIKTPPYVSKQIAESVTDTLDAFKKFIEIKQLSDETYKPTDEDLHQFLSIVNIPKELFFKENSELRQRGKSPLMDSNITKPGNLFELLLGKNVYNYLVVENGEFRVNSKFLVEG